MKQVQAFIEEQHMIQAGDHVVAGVSGGADSVCLLFELLEYQKKCAFAIEVAHVEHGIRGAESLEDAAFVEKLCKDAGVPFRLYRFDVEKLAKQWKMTVEEAGRKARYDAFAQACAGCANSKIAVAHNIEDQAETILMHLARGSGLRGLCGIWPVRGNIIRPLLSVKRAQIESSLQKRGISWREDRTNQELDYARNRVRLQALPALASGVNEKAAEHIAAAGRRLRRAEHYLEQEAARLAEGMTSCREGSVEISRASFGKLDGLMQEYIVRGSLERLGGGLHDIGEVHIQEICRLAAGENGKRLDLPDGVAARNKNEVLVLEKKRDKERDKEQEDRRRASMQAQELRIPGVTRWGGYRVTASFEKAENLRIEEKKYTKWFDYDRIKYKIQIRTRQTGDYLEINDAGDKKTLKKYLIEEKILREERDFVPLLADGSHILWVVGRRISAAGKVSGQTVKILKIQIEPEETEEKRQHIRMGGKDNGKQGNER